jgi:hypothetical protein
MTVANRAIGAPINIWNDHTDCDEPARLGVDPAVCRDQPGSRRPARPGLPDRRRAVAAGHGLHGRVHPHPRGREVDVPEVEPRSPGSCRRSSRARCSTRSSRCRSAPWWVRRRSPRCAISPMSGRCRPSMSSRGSPPSSVRSSTATPAAWCTGLPSGGRRDGRHRPRFGARHDQGRRRRAPRARARRSASSGSRRSDRSRWRPCARRSGRQAVRLRREGLLGRHRRHRRLPRADGDVGQSDQELHDRRGVGRPSHPQELTARCLRQGGRRRPAALTFLDLDHGLVERELARTRADRRSGPAAENILRDLGAVRAGSR